MLNLLNLAACVSAAALYGDKVQQVYGQGLDVAIDAPGVAYHPAYKGFPSQGQGPKNRHYIPSLVASIQNPGWVPRGVNPVKCTPKEGQLPVILIPGTSATVYSNWAYMGPELADEGLCVYSFTHSPLVNPLTGDIVKGTGFMGNLTESSYALSAVIDQVLELTGAKQVDMVGHSQGGGAVPYYYLKNIMQGNKVRKHIGIAPSLGTEAWGLNKLLSFVFSQQEREDFNTLLTAGINAEAHIQQWSGSAWMKALHQNGLTVDNVEYFNIATKFDEVLVPYTNCIVNEPGKKITNIVVQDKCFLDFSDHIGLAYSSNVLQIVKNSLFDTDKPINCVFHSPIPF